jgi:hypothetical protein
MPGDAPSGAEPLRAPAIIFPGLADSTVAPVNVGRLSGQLNNTVRRTGASPGRRFDVLEGRSAAGHPVEVWRIDGAGHAW